VSGINCHHLFRLHARESRCSYTGFGKPQHWLESVRVRQQRTGRARRGCEIIVFLAYYACKFCIWRVTLCGAPKKSTPPRPKRNDTWTNDPFFEAIDDSLTHSRMLVESSWMYLVRRTDVEYCSTIHYYCASSSSFPFPCSSETYNDDNNNNPNYFQQLYRWDIPPPPNGDTQKHSSMSGW